MKIYQTLNIGEFHPIHCEDFLITESISSDEKLIAVLDGCTMGNESVFASILYGKILRKIAKKMFYEDFIYPSQKSLKEKLKQVLSNLLSESKIAKNMLGLEINEMLSTAIVALFSSENKSAEILAIGDGLVCADGELFEYDQNDRPDYVGYHLNEPFDEWYNNQNQILSFPKFNDLSISTDGIFSFKNFERDGLQITESDIIQQLLIDNPTNRNELYLSNQINVLRTQYKQVLTDDLAIIRITY